MTDFRKFLLAGTAIVALGAASPALAELTVDANDDDFATGTVTIADGADLDAGGADTHDARVTVAASGTTTLNLDADITIGNEGTGTPAAAITATDVNQTLVIEDTHSASSVLDIDGVEDGAISAGTQAAFNVTFLGDGTNDDSLTVNVDGSVALGAGTLTVEGGAGGTSANVVVNLLDDVTAQTIVLADSAGAGTATIVFDTETGGDADNIAVSGAINANATDEGTISIQDSDTSNTGAVTFAGAIGGTGATNRVGTLSIGDATATVGGAAVFSSTVNVDTLNVGAADMGGQTATGTFNGDVTANTGINVVSGAAAGGETATATFTGDVTGDITIDGTENSEATVVVLSGSNQTVTGAIDGTGSGENETVAIGTSGSNSNVTIDGVIGSTEIGLLTVVSGSTLNLSNEATTDVIGASGNGIVVDGTLNLVSDSSGAGAFTVSEATGDIDFNGTVDVSGDDDVTIDSADDLFIDGSFSTALTDATNNTTTLTVVNLIRVGESADTTVEILNPVDVSTDTDIGSASTTVRYNVGRSENFDPTTTGGDVAWTTGGSAVTLATGGTLEVGISESSLEFDDGDIIQVIEAGGGGTIDVSAGTLTIVDTGLANLEVDGSSDVDTLNVSISILDPEEVFTSSYGASAAISALDIASGDSEGVLEEARANLINAPTVSAAEDVADSLAPTVDGGATVGAVTVVTNNALGLTGQRLATLRSGETGMAAGNMTHGLKAWGQVFGTTGEQDERDGIAGYEIDTYGVTVGIDTETIAEDWVWGLAFTYADSEVDSNNSNQTQAEIDSYQIALYSEYDWDADTYVSGMVGYGWNESDQRRFDIGGSTADASADFDTDVFFARLEAGRDYDMDNGMTLTPIALANFNYVDTDDYTETGGGTGSLSVETDEKYVFELGLGAEASWLHQLNDGSYVKPKLRAGYRFDVAGDEVETTAAFNGGGATFNTEGFDSQDHTLNVGTGLTFYTTANWELSANYDYEWKGDYDSHNGYVRAAYKF